MLAVVEIQSWHRKAVEARYQPTLCIFMPCVGPRGTEGLRPPGEELPVGFVGESVTEASMTLNPRPPLAHRGFRSLWHYNPQ